MYSVIDYTRGVGLPHSDTPGLQPILSSPGLFAEYHVLRRLSLPRHPPDALLFLILTMCMCDLINHHIPPASFCFLRTFVFFLNSLCLILISAINSYIYANTFKDLIYGLLIHILVTLPIHYLLTTPLT